MEEQIETPYIIRGLVRNFSQTKQHDRFDRGCRSFVFKLSFANKTDTIAQIHSKRQASSASPSHFPSYTLSLPFHFHDTSPLPPHPKTLILSHPFPSSPSPLFRSLQISPSPNPPFPYPLQQKQFTNQNFPYQQQPPPPPRTLFPGGYKRPEIKVANIVPQLDSEDVIRSGSEASDLIDKAVSKSVGIVVLNGGSDGDGRGGRGKSLYEAAFLVKSVVRDRAYLLIGERVDIAAAVNARGVVLSDQGLPAFVVRNMLMGSKSESVVLPLVARIVQTPNAALNASNSEGADFLIHVLGLEKDFDVEMSSGFGNVNIPIFSLYASRGEAKVSMGASKFVNFGASGLVLSLEDLKLFSDDDLSQMFDTASATDKKSQDEFRSSSKLK